MVEGVTSSGFEYKVSPGIAYDAKFLRAAVKMRSETADASERLAGTFEMIDAVFLNNDSEIERFMKHLAGKSPTGRTDVRMLVQETDEIVTAIQEADASVKK